MSQQEDAPARRLYDAIEEIRVRNGWTKVQLARRLNLNRGTLENWKTQPRPPQPGTVTNVAHALGIDPDWALRLAGILPYNSPTPREALANTMARRADELDLEWDDLVSDVPDITREYGPEHLSARDKRVIEEKLRWAPGSVEAILEGGDARNADAEEVDRDEPHLSGLEQRPGEDDVAYAHRLLEAAMGLLRKHDSEQRGA